MPEQLEVWQRGPLPDITPLLQPVAYALLQAREEVGRYMEAFPSSLLWSRPAGLASPGFHLQHLSGVLDRVFTYARGEKLNAFQFEQLHAEGMDLPEGTSIAALVARFNRQVDVAIEQLRRTPVDILAEYRGIGRAGLPSTV